MATNNFLNNLEDYQKDLGVKIFDLVIGRVLEKIYLGLTEKEKEAMDKIFDGSSDEEKGKFAQKYMSNFEELFEEEGNKVEEEIKAEMEKQV